MNEQHPEKMKDFFDSRSGSYDHHMQQNISSFEVFYEKIAEPIAPNKEPVTILDLGCGTGLELEAIFKKAPAARVTGIDLSGEMLEKLSKKYHSRASQIELIQGNYLEWDMGREKFDYVISVMTVHHLLPKPKEQLYRKINRALRPGGTYIEGDYYVSGEKEREFLEKYQALDEEGRGRYHIDIPFSVETQRRLFSGAGFSRMEVIWEEGDSGIMVCRK